MRSLRLISLWGHVTLPWTRGNRQDKARWKKIGVLLWSSRMESLWIPHLLPVNPSKLHLWQSYKRKLRRFFCKKETNNDRKDEYDVESMQKCPLLVVSTRVDSYSRLDSLVAGLWTDNAKVNSEARVDSRWYNPNNQLYFEIPDHIHQNTANVINTWPSVQLILGDFRDFK